MSNPLEWQSSRSPVSYIMHFALLPHCQLITSIAPWENPHFRVSTKQFQWTRAGMLLTAECYIVLLIPNTILPIVQAYTSHGLQRSRNQLPSSNPFSSTHRDEVTTVTYFSFNHLWEQRVPKTSRKKHKHQIYCYFSFFLKCHDLKEKKKKYSIYIL